MGPDFAGVGLEAVDVDYPAEWLLHAGAGLRSRLGEKSAER